MNVKPLFIPLKKEFYDAFRDGSKKWELRGNRGQFKASRIQKGRVARLARGYGYPRLIAKVIDIKTYDSIADIPREIWDETVPLRLQNLETTVALSLNYKGYGYTLMRMEIDREEDFALGDET